jgi:F-type H+-transporting ATPase subunit a
MPKELWITAPFNKFLAGPANACLNAFGIKAADPAHPWADWLTIEIAIVLFIILLFGFLRTRLSVDTPGKLQHCCELLYEFLRAQAEEVVGHGSKRFLAFFGTIFIFVLFMNLTGIIPTLVSPTMFVMVPLGLAVSTFVYYHSVGLRAQGIGGYIKLFFGPMIFLAPIMFPIEIISHSARLLSLTVRLYANMFAGEEVTNAFLGLTYVVIPVIFMCLHIFVSLLQAYIFALLAMVYVGGAVSHEH